VEDGDGVFHIPILFSIRLRRDSIWTIWAVVIRVDCHAFLRQAEE